MRIIHHISLASVNTHAHIQVLLIMRIIHHISLASVNTHAHIQVL